MSGLDSLVELAWQGKPGSLVDVLNKLQAKITALEHRPMVLGDLSESAQKFFAVIGSVSRKPARPSKANVNILAFAANRMLGAATLDRLRHGAYRVILDGDSYRTPKPLPDTSKSTPVKGGKIIHS